MARMGIARFEGLLSDAVKSSRHSRDEPYDQEIRASDRSHSMVKDNSSIIRDLCCRIGRSDRCCRIRRSAACCQRGPREPRSCRSVQVTTLRTKTTLNSLIEAIQRGIGEVGPFRTSACTSGGWRWDNFVWYVLWYWNDSFACD